MSIRNFIGLLVVVMFCSFVSASGYAIRTVQPGESLGSIASLYKVSVESIKTFNDLQSSTVHPGDVLKIPYAGATGGISELAPNPPPGFQTYTLKSGESLSSVAKSFGLTIEAMVGANPDISSLDLLPEGIEVLIPPAQGLVVTLQRGEHLKDILASYDVNPLAVSQANDFVSPNDIRPGMMIFLPGVKPIRALERLAGVREAEKARKAEAVNQASVTQSQELAPQQSSGSYLWPLHGRITSYFGRRNLGMGTSSFHSAIDIAAPTGTPIVAAMGGTVIYAGWSNRGYGNLIKIRHYGQAESWYAHQSEIYVSVGQQVSQGEAIGSVGATGLATGPHLHFELHREGRAVDPLSLLP